MDTITRWDRHNGVWDEVDKHRQLIGEPHDEQGGIFAIPSGKPVCFTYLEKEVYDLVNGCIYRHGEKFLDIMRAMVDENVEGFEFEATMKRVKVSHRTGAIE